MYVIALLIRNSYLDWYLNELLNINFLALKSRCYSIALYCFGIASLWSLVCIAVIELQTHDVRIYVHIISMYNCHWHESLSAYKIAYMVHHIFWLQHKLQIVSSSLSSIILLLSVSSQGNKFDDCHCPCIQSRMILLLVTLKPNVKSQFTDNMN